MTSMSTSRHRAPSWKTHPLYKLRKALLIVDGVAIFLALCDMLADYVSVGLRVFDVLLLGFSLGFVLWDLVSYSHQQAVRLFLPRHNNVRRQQSCNVCASATTQNNADIEASAALHNGTNVAGGGGHDDDHDDGDKLDWPRLALVIIDAILAALLFLSYITSLGAMNIPYGWRPPGLIFITVYAGMAVLVAAVLHAICFWKELMARRQQKWLRQLARGRGITCARCGDRVTPTTAPAVLVATPTEDGSEADPATVVRGMSDSVKRRLAELLRRGSAGLGTGTTKLDGGDGEDQQTEEDSLLATPEGSSASTTMGYGGVEDGGEALSAPEERIVKKKCKGRLIDA